jgi:hypothetical protein
MFSTSPEQRWAPYPRLFLKLDALTGFGLEPNFLLDFLTNGPFAANVAIEPSASSGARP